MRVCEICESEDSSLLYVPEFCFFVCHPPSECFENMILKRKPFIESDDAVSIKLRESGDVDSYVQYMRAQREAALEVMDSCKRARYGWGADEG